MTVSYEEAVREVEAALGWTDVRGNNITLSADTLRSLLSGPPEPSEEEVARVEPRPYAGYTGGKVEEYFGFDGGSLTIKTTGHDVNGSGYMCFSEDDLEWEQDQETGKQYRILNLSNSELIFIRDRLCEVFPASPIPATEPTLADVRRVLTDCTANSQTRDETARAVQQLFRSRRNG